jgi:hypothetical protein
LRIWWRGHWGERRAGGRKLLLVLVYDVTDQFVDADVGGEQDELRNNAPSAGLPRDATVRMGSKKESLQIRSVLDSWKLQVEVEAAGVAVKRNYRIGSGQYTLVHLF